MTVTLVVVTGLILDAMLGVGIVGFGPTSAVCILAVRAVAVAVLPLTTAPLADAAAVAGASMGESALLAHAATFDSNSSSVFLKCHQVHGLSL